MTTMFLDRAPAEAIGPAMRVTPIRKPVGFTPVVQRWSFLLPDGEPGLHLAFFGAQAPDATALDSHPLHDWVRMNLAGHPSGPTCIDHARIHPGEHVVAAYWVHGGRFAAWQADAAAEAWWQAPERLQGSAGTWREILRIPRERQESIYWRDYPAALMTSPDVSLFPTPYCGYYGAMRDRLPAAAAERLDSPMATLTASVGREGRSAHWAVQVPHNLAVIRSAHSWGAMDPEQRADYEAKLRVPLATGMDYLAGNPLPTGCASLRWQHTSDAAGTLAPEAHALGYFLSLGHMEGWAEDHATHAAIFGAAMARYKHYGKRNQLRTWHEVFVLPEGGQVFEYLNCAPQTGLLPWFDAVRLR